MVTYFLSCVCDLLNIYLGWLFGRASLSDKLDVIWHSCLVFFLFYLLFFSKKELDIEIYFRNKLEKHFLGAGGFLIST